MMSKKIIKSFLVFILLANLITVPLAKAAPTCEDINNPESLAKDDWIVTIVEEQISADIAEVGIDSNETYIMDCLRVVNTTQTGGQGKTVKGSTYASVGGSCPGESCQRVQVFFSKTGAGLLYAYISLIYRWAAGTIGIVCVLFLVVGGIQIAAAGDNTGRIDEAKQRIMQSIAGLVLLFLSAVILYTINPNFFTQ